MSLFIMYLYFENLQTPGDVKVQQDNTNFVTIYSLFSLGEAKCCRSNWREEKREGR